MYMFVYVCCVHEHAGGSQRLILDSFSIILSYILFLRLGLTEPGDPWFGLTLASWLCICFPVKELMTSFMWVLRVWTWVLVFSLNLLYSTKHTFSLQLELLKELGCVPEFTSISATSAYTYPCVLFIALFCQGSTSQGACGTFLPRQRRKEEVHPKWLWSFWCEAASVIELRGFRGWD